MHHQYLLQTLAGYLQCCTAVFHLCITLIRGVPGLWSCLRIDVWNPDPRKLVAKLSLTVSIISSKTFLFTATKTCCTVSVKSWGGAAGVASSKFAITNLPAKLYQARMLPWFSGLGNCKSGLTVLKNPNQSLLNYSFGHFLKISLLTVM